MGISQAEAEAIVARMKASLSRYEEYLTPDDHDLNNKMQALLNEYTPDNEDVADIFMNQFPF